MGPKLARMLIQVSSVVSTTSTRLMPSMPTVYSMPKAGIQGTFSTKLEAADAGRCWVEASASSASESAKATQRHDERHDADEIVPVTRAGRPARRAPTSGTSRMSVRIGTPRQSVSATTITKMKTATMMSAEGDAQGVVLDAPGLDLAQVACRRPGSTSPTPLTVPSMTARRTTTAPLASRPPMRTKSRWLRSSNHHLLNEAR